MSQDPPNPTPTRNPFDAYSPAEMAARVEQGGVAKAGMGTLATLTLAVLAGAFIAFGAMLYTLVMTGHGLGFGPARLLGGVAFSLGLILVVVGGAELFTGNSLIVMAWAGRRVSTARLLRNWGLVYFGNAVGAVATAALLVGSGSLGQGGGEVLETAAGIARAKVELPFHEAVLRGVLCNVLVCLAVWLSYAAHHVGGKILAIVPPVTAFVALGFEHSIANMYLIPVAMLAGVDGVGPAGLLGNLVPVTLGNMLGGGVLVALVYWLVYLRKR